MIERRTNKKILADSIMELMNQKSLHKITVQMITDNCNLTRQTFYYYFKDKYDLVNWIFESLINEICQTFSPNRPWNQVLGKMLVAMKEHQKFYLNAIHCEGQNSFHQYIAEYTKTAYARELKKRLDNLDDDMLFSIEFNSYGAAGTICSWIENSMEEDPYKLANRIADNMPQRMKEYFS